MKSAFYFGEKMLGSSRKYFSPMFLIDADIFCGSSGWIVGDDVQDSIQRNGCISVERGAGCWKKIVQDENKNWKDVF